MNIICTLPFYKTLYNFTFDWRIKRLLAISVTLVPQLGNYIYAAVREPEILARKMPYLKFSQDRTP